MFRKRYGMKRKIARARYGRKKTSPGVLALKKVNRLVRARKQNAQWLNFFNSVQNLSLAQVTAYNMCNYQTLTTSTPGVSGPIFGSGSDDVTDPKILYHSTQMRIRVALESPTNNEESTTRFSCFLVSLQDRVPQSKFNNSLGTLTLTAGQDFNIVQGVTYLNKKIFKVHKSKFFTLSNYDTSLSNPAAQTQFGTDREWSWNIAPKMTIEHPAGNWSALASSLDPSKQYYVLVFTDNQTGDLESPQLNIHQLANFKRIASA